MENFLNLHSRVFVRLCVFALIDTVIGKCQFKINRSNFAKEKCTHTRTHTHTHTRNINSHSMPTWNENRQSLITQHHTHTLPHTQTKMINRAADERDYKEKQVLGKQLPTPSHTLVTHSQLTNSFPPPFTPKSY